MRAKASWNCASQIICNTSTKEEYGEYSENSAASLLYFGLGHFK